MRYGVLFGGRSFEHEISIVSAIALKEQELIEGVFLFLDQEHEWYLIEPKALRADLFIKGEYKKMPKVRLEKSGFYLKGLLGSKRVEMDRVLNLIHGGDGEDGHIAALLDFYEIPYIGPRVEASVVGFNKLLTKLYAKEMGCAVLPYQLLRRGEPVELEFAYPVILKPVRLGSSIGLAVAKNKEELEYGLDVAFEFDDEVLIEPFIEGIDEYNLAGCKSEDFCFSRIEKVQKGSLLDFEQKYMDFAREEVAGADLPTDLQAKMKDSFAKVYDPLFLGSLVRMDFFVHEDEVYLNEINAVPGSLAHYLFDDFQSVLRRLATNLPKSRRIPIEYRYISSISAKK